MISVKRFWQYFLGAWHYSWHSAWLSVRGHTRRKYMTLVIASLVPCLVCRIWFLSWLCFLFCVMDFLIGIEVGFLTWIFRRQLRKMARFTRSLQMPKKVSGQISVIESVLVCLLLSWREIWVWITVLRLFLFLNFHFDLQDNSLKHLCLRWKAIWTSIKVCVFILHFGWIVSSPCIAESWKG